jgi:hypothetical protein
MLLKMILDKQKGIVYAVDDILGKIIYNWAK